MRRVAWWLILLLVLANGIVGLLNGPRDWLEAENGKERLLAFSVTVYGIAGMITFPGLLMRRRWVMIPMILWAITTAFAGTYATLLYSPPESRWIASTAAAVMSMVLLGLIVIQARREIFE